MLFGLFVVQGVVLLLSMFAAIATMDLDYALRPGTPAFVFVRRTLRVLIVCGFLAAIANQALGEMARQESERNAEREKAELRASISSVQAAADKAAKDFAAEREAADSRHQQTKTALAEVSAKLEPFIELARQRHKGLGEDAGLSALRREIQGISARTAAIEGAIAPRKLEAMQSERSRALLADVQAKARAAGGTCAVHFSAIAGDQEAQQYGSALRDLFAASGWRSHQIVTMAMIAGGGVFGLKLQVTRGSRNPCFLVAEGVLRGLDSTLAIEVWPSDEIRELEVTVGSRPQR